MNEVLVLLSAFIGILVVIFTRFTLLGSIMSVASFILYFVLFSTGQWLYFILLFLGIIMMILEIFIPSFGIVGIVGIALTGLGLLLSSQFPIQTLGNFGLAFSLATAIAIILLKCGVEMQFGKGFVLKTQIKGISQTTEVDEPNEHYLYKTGIAITSLRPVGKIRIDDQDVEALSSNDMIDVGEKVKVYKVEGSKIFVRKEES